MMEGRGMEGFAVLEGRGRNIASALPRARPLLFVETPMGSQGLGVGNMGRLTK